MVTLKAQLVEKQAVQSENDRLKLQLDSIHTQTQIEQKKAGEDRLEGTNRQITYRHVQVMYFNFS